MSARILAALVLIGAACAPASHDAERVTAVAPSSSVATTSTTSSSTSAPATSNIGTAWSVVRESAPASSRHLPQRSTTPARPTPTTRASRSEPGRGVVVESTAYCLTGTMANGQRAHRGAVAANRWPLGTRLRVTPSPVGELVTVEDRIGHGSELDFAMPGDCAAARQWGRRAVTVEVVG